MNSYAPTNYRCPFCVLTGVDDENAYSGKTDIVYHNDEVTAFISPHQYPGSPGTTIVIPNMHVGNMHDLSIYLVMRMHELTQTIALAMKEVYDCDGVFTRQHSEPIGYQDVWHYHIHVTPRYADNNLYTDCASRRQLIPLNERTRYAQKLSVHLENWKPVQPESLLKVLL